MAITVIFYCKQCKKRNEVYGFKDIEDFFSNYVCSCGYQPNSKEYKVLSFKDKDKIKYVLTHKKEFQLRNYD